MKTIVLKITAPKCGASSDALREAFAAAIGADVDMVGGRLAVMPPDVKKIVSEASAVVRKTLHEHTLPWIGTERVCVDSKIDIATEEIEAAGKKAVAKIEEQAKAMKVWLPKVKKALGKGADMVDLPVAADFKMTVSVGKGEATDAGEGLPKNATAVQINQAKNKGDGFEAVINHLISLAQKVGPGKAGSQAALKLKEDAATAVALGAVDANTLKLLNKLTGAVLVAGKSGATKAAASAALVTGIANGAKKAPDPAKAATKKDAKAGKKLPTLQKGKNKAANTATKKAAGDPALALI